MINSLLRVFPHDSSRARFNPSSATMTFSSPMFWYHQGPRAHQLPDARSDAKGQNVLRKIRAGYATISPQRTASSTPTLPEAQLEPQPETQPEPLAEAEEPSEEERPPTPPDYESIDPPPYAHPLPPALPGYTPLPDVVPDSARDLKQPLKVQRRRYRDVLRKRLPSTKKIFGRDGGEAEGSETDFMCESDGESARGVVLYREDGHWVGTTDPLQSKDEVLPRQRGFRGWLKRVWQRVQAFSDEHPYLFILAIFVIVVVVLCLLI